MTIKYKGENVLQKDLIDIAEHFTLSFHARERIDERHPGLDIKNAILNSVLAYFNTDGTINCAINQYEYFVIATDKFPYKVITFKEKSWNSKTIFDKQRYARLGYARAV